MAQFLPMDRFHSDPTNKWSPNMAGLVAMVEDAGFSVVRSAVTGFDRGLVEAVAVENPERSRITEMDRSERDVP
ncbi:MAG: hypothetical protein OSB70_16030 [Myxococcota bacterium]|nr:hypothetical protein [Myxococcota bacterium]